MKHFAFSVLHFFKRPIGRAAVTLACAMLVLVGLGVLSTESFDVVPSAFAAEDTEDIFSILGSAVGKGMAEIATIAIKFLGIFVYMALNWIGELMDNTFIFDGGMGEKLQSVWIIVRNFVNIFFALALVVVALMSVVGYGDESGNYGLKKFIPKMALALIAVNFTFLACRVVLDVNNVLTTAIFSIPQSVTNLSDFTAAGGEPIKLYRKYKCLDSTAAKAAKAAEGGNNTNKDGVSTSLGGVCYAEPFNPTPDLPNGPDANGQGIITLGANNFTHKGFVWAMATQFQGLQNLNQVAKLVENKFSGLATTAIFSVIFAVIYGMAYIAMFVVLLARVVVLWLCIMLSPLAALTIVFPDILPDKLNIKTFIDQAFVPAKMAVPLSFGYIMLSQMALSIDTNDPIFQDKLINLSSGELTRGGSVGSIMYGAASVAVVWLGVLAASEGVVGSEFVTSMSEYVKNAGVKIAKTPLYVPWIPVSSGNVSLSTLAYTGKAAQQMLERNRQKSDESFFQKTFGGNVQSVLSKFDDLVKKSGTENLTGSKIASEVNALTSNSTLTYQDKKGKLQEFMKQSNDGNRNNFARAIGLNETEINTILDNGTAADIQNLSDRVAKAASSGGAGRARESYLDHAGVKLGDGSIDITGAKDNISEDGRSIYGTKISEKLGLREKQTKISSNNISVENVTDIMTDSSISLRDRKAFLRDIGPKLKDAMNKSKPLRETFMRDTGSNSLQTGLTRLANDPDSIQNVKEIFSAGYIDKPEDEPQNVKNMK